MFVPPTDLFFFFIPLNLINFHSSSSLLTFISTQFHLQSYLSLILYRSKLTFLSSFLIWSIFTHLHLHSLSLTRVSPSELPVYLVNLNHFHSYLSLFVFLTHLTYINSLSLVCLTFTCSHLHLCPLINPLTTQHPPLSISHPTSSLSTSKSSASSLTFMVIFASLSLRMFPRAHFQNLSSSIHLHS